MDRKSFADSDPAEETAWDPTEANPAIEVQIAEAFVAVLAKDRLRAMAEAVLQYEGITGQATVVITDDAAIQELSRDFLGVDAPTDVLSFSAQEDVGDFVVAPEEVEYLGDVIISYPRAVAQAAEAGQPVEQELDLLIVHGMLHLLGYDHADEVEKAAMWAMQADILSRGRGSS